MNFNLDNLKEEEIPQKKQNNENGGGNVPSQATKLIVAVGALLLVAIIGGVCVKFLVLDKKTPAQPVATPTDAVTEEDVARLPLDHSGNLAKTRTQVEGYNEYQLGHEILLLDTIFKVERIALFEGNMDGSAPRENDTLDSYVASCYFIPEAEKTSCQKFYCAMWDGEESLAAYTFEFLKERGLGNTSGYDNYDQYFEDYANAYFTGDYNSLSSNTGNKLRTEGTNFIYSVQKDSRTGFYTYTYSDSFLNHIEDCSRFLPENAINFNINSRDGSNTFSIMTQVENSRGELEDKEVKYYFHQTSDGTIFYDTNSRYSEESTKITYMNRYEMMDFYYYEEDVQSRNISRDDINALLDMGYTWVESNALQKSENGKTHRIYIKN